ncbi:uncharacterized protein IUM83_18793 [Phytophthora cinnamomi]|uniref:uncharacterized protein n=1 Tax=Phytophthora cinnamomi TaxID=4785 RepID=UPI00355946F3|nr:hypothetical protein IUM83_18793 [Phytophthora cinnamomi]
MRLPIFNCDLLPSLVPVVSWLAPTTDRSLSYNFVPDSTLCTTPVTASSRSQHTFRPAAPAHVRQPSDSAPYYSFKVLKVRLPGSRRLQTLFCDKFVRAEWSVAGNSLKCPRILIALVWTCDSSSARSKELRHSSRNAESSPLSASDVQIIKEDGQSQMKTALRVIRRSTLRFQVPHQ